MSSIEQYLQMGEEQIKNDLQERINSLKNKLDARMEYKYGAKVTEYSYTIYDNNEEDFITFIRDNESILVRLNYSATSCPPSVYADDAMYIGIMLRLLNIKFNLPLTKIIDNGFTVIVDSPISGKQIFKKDNGDDKFDLSADYIEYKTDVNGKAKQNDDLHINEEEGNK